MDVQPCREKFWKRTNQKKTIPSIIGFDTETHGSKNRFVLGTLYENENSIMTSRSRNDMINVFHEMRLTNTWYAATNLMFDFCSVFWKEKDFAEFRIVEKHGRFLWCKTNIKKTGEFCRDADKHTTPLMFIDTLNYAGLGVEKLGKMIGIPKLSTPLMGKVPQSEAEWKELIAYNVRDAEITKKGLDMLFSTFHLLGGSIKPTIAAVAISTISNRYLNDCYHTHTREQLEWELVGYHGGRTEAFDRGHIEGKYYWIDANSMYPSVMHDYDYPDPNFLRISNENTAQYIREYHGISDVVIWIPPMMYPPIPYRHDGKLLFPYGILKGRYTHAELRYAMKLGARIMKVNTSYYCKASCEPFRDFVKDLYGKRMMWEDMKDPRSEVAKILLNASYGKLCQKFDDIDEYVPIDSLNMDDIIGDVMRFGDLMRVKKHREPRNFCIPMFGAHITAYARTRIHAALEQYNGIYTDTDCVATLIPVEHSRELGKFKVDKIVNDQYIHRPKSYAFYDMKAEAWKCKSKGIPKKLSIQEWKSLVRGEPFVYEKFMKFRESVVRGFDVNEIVNASKLLSNDENKRWWLKPFSIEDRQTSVPLKILEDGGVQTINTYDEDREAWLQYGYIEKSFD